MKAVHPRCSQQHSLMWKSPLLLSGISSGNQEAVHLDEQPLFSVQTLLPVDCALYAKLCTLSNTVLLHPEKLNPTAMQEFLLAEAGLIAELTLAVRLFIAELFFTELLLAKAGLVAARLSVGISICAAETAVAPPVVCH